jgi:hypothetical protein
MNIQPVNPQGPITESLYRDDESGKIIRVFGENHDMIGNMSNQPVETYLMNELRTNPNIKVYGEFVDDLEHIEQGYLNPHLKNLNEYYASNSEGMRRRRKLSSVNTKRDRIIEIFDDMRDNENESIEEAKENFIENTKEAFDELGYEPHLIGRSQQDIDRIQQEREDLEQELIEEEDEDFIKEISDEYVRPLVEAEMLKKLERQPRNKNYTFYVGYGHKDEFDRVLPLVYPDFNRLF